MSIATRPCIVLIYTPPAKISASNIAARHHLQGFRHSSPRYVIQVELDSATPDTAPQALDTLLTLSVLPSIGAVTLNFMEDNHKH